MVENNDDLNSFLSQGSSDSQASQAPQEEKEESFDLEDEFSKLLSDFIAQDTATTPQNQTSNLSNASPNQPQQASNNESLGGLDDMLTPTTENTNGWDSISNPAPENTGGLDDMLTPTTENNNSWDSISNSTPENAGGLDSMLSSAPENTGGLDDMLSPTMSSDANSGLDGFVSPEEPNSSNLDSMVSEDSVEQEAEEGTLKSEEQELARAISNFQDGVTAMAHNKNLKMPETDYVESMLYPNYKPSIGKKIAQYMLNCWDVINKYDPEDMKKLSPEADDEEYLSFAESLSDTYMQLAIISYVEILINIEICEVSYEQKKELAIKNRIKRELYEEYMELQERKNKFIQKLKEKNFPIDVDKLMNNYFRAAQKDEEGAFEALTKNPAMFSRIEVEKLKPKFFGLIKVTPEDGIKANQKIGAFIKKLKV